MAPSAKARLKISTGWLSRGSAGRESQPANQKKPRGTAGAKPMSLKTISKPSHTDALPRTDGFGTLYHARKDSADQKRPQALGCVGPSTGRRAMLWLPAFRLRPPGRYEQAGRAFGRPRAVSVRVALRS